MKRYELRPGTPTEWMTGNIMNRLIKMVEMRRERVYRQTATVKKIEERKKTVYVSGSGKDCVTRSESDGWWITFTDNLTAVRCETKPDCEPGDKAVCTWEFHRP